MMDRSCSLVTASRRHAVAQVGRSGACRRTLFTLLIFLLGVPGALMAESQPPKKPATQSDTVGDISIVGSTELPKAVFSLPWRLPSVEKREDEAPPREVGGVLDPLEPKRHRKQIYFDRHLDLEMPSYQVK